MRIEKDHLGELEIGNTLYGIHTHRALNNFALPNYKRTNKEIIKAIALVKLAAAQANFKAKKLSEEKATNIKIACEEIYDGKHSEAFPLPAIQGGAGTSTNMNLNEVIANIALVNMNHKKGDYHILSPIEDVNLSQSTNDVYPTAVKISIIKVLRELVQETMYLQDSLQAKEKEFSNIYRLGRTQMQDAVPLTLGETFSAFAEGISRDRWRLYKIEERIRRVNIGGTAIGTGVGANLRYRFYISEELKRLTGYGLSRAENLIDGTQNLDAFVEVSSLIKTMAVTLNKISSDLILLSSGPKSGFGEINLPAIQAGSSIMPGKVNPVGAEFIKQIYHIVLGNDLTLTTACASGQLELNAMVPIIAENLLESIELLRDGIKKFRITVIDGITANEEVCKKYVEESSSTITLLIDRFGYDKLTEILKECKKTGKTYEEILRENENN